MSLWQGMDPLNRDHGNFEQVTVSPQPRHQVLIKHLSLTFLYLITNRTQSYTLISSPRCNWCGIIGRFTSRSRVGIPKDEGTWQDFEGTRAIQPIYLIGVLLLVVYEASMVLRLQDKRSIWSCCASFYLGTKFARMYPDTKPWTKYGFTSSPCSWRQPTSFLEYISDLLAPSPCCLTGIRVAQKRILVAMTWWEHWFREYLDRFHPTCPPQRHFHVTPFVIYILYAIVKSYIMNRQ